MALSNTYASFYDILANGQFDQRPTAGSSLIPLSAGFDEDVNGVPQGWAEFLTTAEAIPDYYGTQNRVWDYIKRGRCCLVYTYEGEPISSIPISSFVIQEIEDTIQEGGQLSIRISGPCFLEELNGRKVFQPIGQVELKTALLQTAVKAPRNTSINQTVNPGANSINVAGATDINESDEVRFNADTGAQYVLRVTSIDGNKIGVSGRITDTVTQPKPVQFRARRLVVDHPEYFAEEDRVGLSLTGGGLPNFYTIESIADPEPEAEDPTRYLYLRTGINGAAGANAQLFKHDYSTPTSQDIAMAMRDVLQANGGKWELTIQPNRTTQTSQAPKGATILAVLQQIAKDNGETFRLQHIHVNGYPSRVLHWIHTPAFNGIELVAPDNATIRADERNGNKAIIQSLSARDDNTVFTKAYITGGKAGEERLTLRECSPATLEWAFQQGLVPEVSPDDSMPDSIENPDLIAQFGLLETDLDFPDIIPENNTPQARTAAADKMLRQAVHEMYRYNSERRTIEVTCIAKKAIRAGDLIALAYIDEAHFGLKSFQYNTPGNYLYVTSASSAVENDVLTYDLVLSTQNWGYWAHEETDASFLVQLAATVRAMRTAMNVDPSGTPIIDNTGGGGSTSYTAGHAIAIVGNAISVLPTPLAGNALSATATQLSVNPTALAGNALQAQTNNTKLGISPSALAGTHLTAESTNTKLGVNLATLGPALAGAGIGYGGGTLNLNTAVPLQITGDTLSLKLGSNPALVIDGSGGLSLNTPLDVGAMTANSLGASHSHAVVTATDGRLATNTNTAHRTILAANYQGALGLAQLSTPHIKSVGGENLLLAPATKVLNLLGNLFLTDNLATISATAGSLTLLGTDVGTGGQGSVTLAGTKELILNNWQAGWKLRSSNYLTQTSGFAISYGETGGHGDFRSLYADEMHVRAFIADLEQALAGGQVITKSVAVLNRKLTLPATVNSTVRVYVQDFPGWAGTAVFDRRINDRVRLVYLDRSQGLDYAPIWGEVQRDSYVNEGDGEQSWLIKFTYLGSGAFAANKTVGKGAIILDYGREPRAHFYEVNAIDPAGAPWVRAGSHTQFNGNGTPAATSIHFQAGNLASMSGFSDEVGVFAGDSLNTHYAAFTNRRGEMHGIAHTLYDSGGRDGLHIRLHAMTLDTQVNATGAVTSKMPSADVATNNVRKSSGASAAYTYVANNPSTGQPDATYVSNSLPQYAALKLGFAAYPTNTKIGVLKAFIAHEDTSTGDDVTLYAQLFNGGTAVSDEVVVDRFSIPYNATNGSFVTIPFTNIAGDTDWTAIQILFNWRYEALNRTPVIKLDPAVPSIAVGNPLPTGPAAGTGFWAGSDGGIYKVRVGDPAASNLLYDGAALVLTSGATGAQIALSPTAQSIALGNPLPTGTQSGGAGFWVGLLSGNSYGLRIGGAMGIGPQLLYDGTTNSLQLRRTDGTALISFTGSGEGAGYLAGPITIGPNGGLWQGLPTSSFTNPKSGWKLWRDAAGAGRFETYNADGAVQVSIDSNGQLVAGEGRVLINRDGLTLYAEGGAKDFNEIPFLRPGGERYGNLSTTATASVRTLDLGLEYGTARSGGLEIYLGGISYNRLVLDTPEGDASVGLNTGTGFNSAGFSVNNTSFTIRSDTTYASLSGADLYIRDYGIAVGWQVAPTFNLNRGQIVSDLAGAHDYEAIVLLDTGDVAHGMTGAIANTAAYGALAKYSASAGGLSLRGYGEGYVGTHIFGAMTTATTGTNTAPVILDGAIKSGTSVAALTTGNLLSVNNYGASRVIVKYNGDIYSDSTAGVLLFDEHDDAALLRALSYELNPAAVIRNRFDDFVAYNRADLEAAGIVEGTMVNQTALARLLTGAIWQLHSRIAELEARLGRAA